MEKKQITGIVCIPTVNNPGNAFEVLHKVSNMLGHFHCAISDEAALLQYDGIISSENKDKLEEIVKPYNFTLLYIEMYEDDERLGNNTINLTNNEEI